MSINENQTRLWGAKPYRSLDWELRKRFGEKVYKLALDGGMTCPNRDGRVGYGGCIFCSAGGSGEFAADRRLSVTRQISEQKEALKKKKNVGKFIAYFQAYTNTYAPVEYLERIFLEAIQDPEVVVLSIATRPDCLPKEVLELLWRLNKMKPVWVELGLQTIHEGTARFIRRGYELAVFECAVKELRARNIEVVVHTILGLPGEGTEEVLQTIDYLNHCDIQGIKMQLLHYLKGTELGRRYLEAQDGDTGALRALQEEEYVNLVLTSVEHLSPNITIHRLTGDGPKELLLAPLWSTRKRAVLNEIHHKMKQENSWQGRKIAIGGKNEEDL